MPSVWGVLLCVVVGAGAAHAATGDESEPTLKLSGNRTTTLRYQRFSGFSPAASALFQSGFTRHETTRLKVSGQALETIKIEGEIFQNDVDFDNQYRLRLATKHYELYLGEFSATFDGSEFTLFNRHLQGAKLTGEVPLSDQPAPKIEFTLINSSPRGQARYEKFFGADIQGPYQLGFSPVVLESERVLVDKVKQVRNVDYEINYIIGQITFKKRVVERRSLVEVTYESRQTLYPRALYGGQVKYQFTDYDTISFIGLDERDRKDAATFAFSGVPATAQTVFGTTFRHDGEFMRLGGEYAHSLFDADRFNKGAENGNAYKGSLELERFGLLVGGDAKKMEPRYRTLGNTALGRDFLGWSSHGGLRVGRLFSVQGEHRQQRTLLDGSPNRLRSTDAKAVLSPKGWPKETYRYYQSAETYDFNYDRIERRHTGDVTHTFSHLTLGTGYERQEITFRDGSQPDRIWDAGKGSVGLRGIAWLAASLNGEVRQGKTSSSLFASSQKFQTILGTANVGFTPSARYYLGGSNNWRKTTGQQPQNTLRTEAAANPIDQISTEISFSQETLQMFYVGAPRDARTNSYAALVEVQPLKSLLALYQPSLRETVLSGLQPAANANRRDAYTVRWAVGSFASLEGTLTKEVFRLRDTNDPALRIQTSQDTDTWKTSLGLAPVKYFSMQLGYTDRLSTKAQFNVFAPTFYDTRDTRQQTARVGLKPQLEAKLGLDASYQFERFRQRGSQGVATSLPAFNISSVSQQVQDFSLLNDYTELHTNAHTVNTGVSYQWVKQLISTATFAYDLKQDRLGVVPDVKTLSAGSGLTFRIKKFKVQGTYRLAQSRGGADTQQQAFSGSLDFIPAPQVRWSNRVEYSISKFPATEATDITSSLEVSF